MSGAISIDPAKVRRHVDEVVRGTVEQTLNALLDAEADQFMWREPVRAFAGPGGHAGGEL